MPYGRTCAYLDYAIYLTSIASVFLSNFVSFMDHHVGFITGMCAALTFIANEHRKNRLEKRNKTHGNRKEINDDE